MREPLYSLACENFSRFHQQDEHNASCFFMSAAQIPPKNRRKDTKKSEKQADLEIFSDKSRDFFLYYQKKTYFCAIKLIIWTALPRIARDSSR